MPRFSRATVYRQREYALSIEANNIDPLGVLEGVRKDLTKWFYPVGADDELEERQRFLKSAYLCVKRGMSFDDSLTPDIISALLSSDSTLLTYLLNLNNEEKEILLDHIVLLGDIELPTLVYKFQ